MVNDDNILRPNLLGAILRLHSRFPTWKHVILTENTFDSTCEMFEKCPRIEPVFDMVLCRENYFSRAAIRKYFVHNGHWWFWGRKIRREKTKRRERRVNDLFIGKNVVLIDDLHHGRIPNHSCCVHSKVWDGEAKSQSELDWPDKLEPKILDVLKRLYSAHPVPVIK